MNTFDATNDLMPDEGVATHSIRAVFYLDADGDEVYSFAYEGDATLSAWLGALELLKEDVIANYRGGRVYEEDE